MKHIKEFNKFNISNNKINEEFMFELGISALLIFLFINYRYSRFGYSHGPSWGETRQKFPFRGFIKYIKMSRIINKYKNKIKEIDKNILDRNPEIESSLKELKTKAGIDTNYIDMTSPVLRGKWFVEKILKTCTPEERKFVQQLSDDFNREMEELFYE